MATFKQTNIHTHVCNVVPLVWGSLRLGPIISQSFTCIQVQSHTAMLTLVKELELYT